MCVCVVTPCGVLGFFPVVHLQGLLSSFSNTHHRNLGFPVQCLKIKLFIYELIFVPQAVIRKMQRESRPCLLVSPVVACRRTIASITRRMWRRKMLVLSRCRASYHKGLCRYPFMTTPSLISPLLLYPSVTHGNR